MTLDCTDKGKVKVKMEKYIKVMNNKFPFPELLIDKTATTPATKNSFKVNPNATKLDQH